MILIAYESKIAPKSHDKLLYVTHYGLFNDTLIHIFSLIHLKFLHIDIVKQIFILEHTDGFPGICRRHGLQEVIRSISCIPVQVLFQPIAQIVFIPFVKNGLMDIKQHFI